MISQLYSLVQQWLSTARSDVTWIQAEQNIVPPAPESKNFGSYVIIDDSDIGIDGASFKYDSGADKFLEKAFSYRQLVLSINVFTIDQTAPDILNDVLLATSLQSFKDMFNLAGFGVLRYSNIRNLSEVISGRYIKRMQVDVEIEAVNQFEAQIDRIVEIPIDGLVDNTQINMVIHDSN